MGYLPRSMLEKMDMIMWIGDQRISSQRRPLPREVDQKTKQVLETGRHIVAVLPRVVPLSELFIRTTVGAPSNIMKRTNFQSQ